FGDLMKIAIGKRFFLFSFLLLVTLSARLQSQGQGRSDEPIKLGTELVVLDVQVLHKKTGRVIGGLSQEDFTLYEDGVKQQITHFSQDKLPLSIVLLLDISGSVWPLIDQIQDGGLRALQRLKLEDEVALMTFDTEAAIIQDFTKDRQLIANKIANTDGMRAVLNHARRMPGDGTHIADSIYQAANHLRKAANPMGRRVIIVVTDNKPFETWIAHSQREVVNQLFETGAVVYGLITEAGSKPSKLVRSMDYHPAVWLARKLKLLRNYNKGGGVDLYANYTGGVVGDGRKSKAEEKLAELIELIRSRYSFGYISSNQKRDGKFRKIKLKVSRDVEKREGDLVILTRKGYYARQADGRKRAATRGQPSRQN
ncbi:MAG TPA: VWA domain-containing protein, partial [Blastocatellia bacterium]|nr:VWA domain-containing protein [Blastocatellia bacterium]